MAKLKVQSASTVWATFDHRHRPERQERRWGSAQVSARVCVVVVARGPQRGCGARHSLLLPSLTHAVAASLSSVRQHVARNGAGLGQWQGQRGERRRHFGRHVEQQTSSTNISAPWCELDRQDGAFGSFTKASNAPNDTGIARDASCTSRK